MYLLIVYKCYCFFLFSSSSFPYIFFLVVPCLDFFLHLKEDRRHQHLGHYSPALKHTDYLAQFEVQLKILTGTCFLIYNLCQFLVFKKTLPKPKLENSSRQANFVFLQLKLFLVWYLSTFKKLKLCELIFGLKRDWQLRSIYGIY